MLLLVLRYLCAIRFLFLLCVVFFVGTASRKGGMSDSREGRKEVIVGVCWSCVIWVGDAVDAVGKRRRSRGRRSSSVGRIVAAMFVALWSAISPRTCRCAVRNAEKL